jgi:soluble lytic murein transglycosylase-like protein
MFRFYPNANRAALGHRRTATACLLLALSIPAHADPVDRWRAEIAEASMQFGVPVDWIERVIRAESGGQTRLNGRPITSRAGAMGLMQLMPATWAELRAVFGFGVDPHDPRANILAGTAYLRAMYDRFGYPGLFAAYNAGPHRYADVLAGRSGLPDETRRYLASVAPPTKTAQPMPKAMRSPSIFAVQNARATTTVRLEEPSNATGLFAIRH